MDGEVVGKLGLGAGALGEGDGVILLVVDGVLALSRVDVCKLCTIGKIVLLDDQPRYRKLEFRVDGEVSRERKCQRERDVSIFRRREFDLPSFAWLLRTVEY